MMWTEYDNRMAGMLSEVMMESSDMDMVEMGERINMGIWRMIAKYTQKDSYIVGDSLIEFKRGSLKMIPLPKTKKEWENRRSMHTNETWSHSDIEGMTRVSMGNRVADNMLYGMLLNNRHEPEELRELKVLTKREWERIPKVGFGSVKYDRTIEIMNSMRSLKEKADEITQLNAE